jgi:hypothetical protein
MNEQAKLRNQYLRARFGDFHFEIMIQFRRSHRVPHQLTELFSPL